MDDPGRGGDKADEVGPKVERLHCNACGTKTKHDVIAERRQEGSEPYDEDISVWWLTIYTLFECRGCEGVTLRRTYIFSEWNPGEEQIEYFPPPLSRRKPTWADRLPEDEQSLLTEVYTALAADSRRL